MNRERLKGHLDLLLLSVLAAGPAGLLSSSWAAVDGRRRRVYALTSKGATALAAEQREWRRFAHGIQAVTGGLATAGGAA
jgi:PadR family transcriptional regulator PadR